MMENAAVISSWSGGKDSCLACYRAMRSGYRVKYLLNFVSRKHKRCCFHGIEARLLKLQSEAVGIPLVQKEVTADMQKYEQEFKEAVSELKAEDIKRMVFGDIYLLDQFNWVERVCRDLDIQPIEPLWNVSPLKIMQEFIASGFRAIVVSCQAELFNRDFVGRYIDKRLIAELSVGGICPCGENGEFHTLVLDGPIFKKKIQISKSRKVLKQGFWKYWFLDIQEYKVADKKVMVPI